MGVVYSPKVPDVENVNNYALGVWFIPPKVHELEAWFSLWCKQKVKEVGSSSRQPDCWLTTPGIGLMLSCRSEPNPVELN